MNFQSFLKISKLDSYKSITSQKISVAIIYKRDVTTTRDTNKDKQKLNPQVNTFPIICKLFIFARFDMIIRRFRFYLFGILLSLLYMYK